MGTHAGSLGYFRFQLRHTGREWNIYILYTKILCAAVGFSSKDQGPGCSWLEGGSCSFISGCEDALPHRCPRASPGEILKKVKPSSRPPPTIVTPPPVNGGDKSQHSLRGWAHAHNGLETAEKLRMCWNQTPCHFLCNLELCLSKLSFLNCEMEIITVIYLLVRSKRDTCKYLEQSLAHSTGPIISSFLY